MTYTVTALKETFDLKPDDDGQVPQLYLPLSFRNAMEVEGCTWDMSGLDTVSVIRAYEEFGDSDTFRRWLNIVASAPVAVHTTRGFSQGDEGLIVAIASPEWRDEVGVEDDYRITPADTRDLGAWIWGDVYAVTDSEDDIEQGYEIVYGMGEAMKYGAIEF